MVCETVYKRIFKYIWIFEYFPPNIDIRIRFVAIFKPKYFCMNISEYLSLKSTWNTWIKEFYFPFLTWRNILTTLLITMIISCWSINPLNTGNLCKAELCMLFRKIFHLCIREGFKKKKKKKVIFITLGPAPPPPPRKW